MSDHDLDDSFDDDYLYFYEAAQLPERSEREAAFIGRTLALTQGQRLLDAPCGYGRIANHAAQQGLRVVGVDRSEVLLAHARSSAHSLEPSVRPTFVSLDLRNMNSSDVGGVFDGAVCWFSSFGYHTEDENYRILENLHSTLVARGRLLLEVLNRDALKSTLSLDRSMLVLASERGRDAIMDRIRLAEGEEGLQVDRLICRGDVIRRSAIAIRAYSFDEIMASLRAVGFADVRQVELQDSEADLVTKWALVVIATKV
ncbi:MAG: class I SAM-dependent methyltransferase [Gaiellaceae bacterium]